MAERLPNLILGAINLSERADASASALRFKCDKPESPDFPKSAYVADCCVCDAFGSVSIPDSISLRFRSEKEPSGQSSTPSVTAKGCDTPPP